VLLTVDVGNTNIVFGVYEGSALRLTFRVATVRTRTADEHGVLLHDLFMLRGLSVKDVTAAIIASVVPPLTDVLADAIRHAFAREPLVVGPGLKTGISVLYDNPRDVGADRICNAVAAYERVHGAVIVVDFGTATTFDCVSAKAEYLGGVIVPGAQVSLDALLGRAAKLGPIELAEPPRVVGKSTTHSLQSGIVFGYASLVDGLVDKITAELGFSCRVLATGGLAGIVCKHARCVEEVDQNLTLEGLRILYERNAQLTPSSSDASARRRRGPH
jgi:type III pantothenate kinase